MIFRKTVFFLLFLITEIGICQEYTKADITDISIVTLVSPGISFEKRVGKLQSLYARAFMGASFWFGYSDTFGSSAGFYLDPAIMLQYRYYYNAKRRQEKGKRTERNSLNYLSPLVEIVFPKRRNYVSDDLVEYYSSVKTVGLLWGFQRNYNSRISLDIDAGIGYRIDQKTSVITNGQTITEDDNGFTPIINIKLGFWLNKRK